MRIQVLVRLGIARRRKAMKRMESMVARPTVREENSLQRRWVNCRVLTRVAMSQARK